jgi:hypothetical protein
MDVLIPLLAIFSVLLVPIGGVMLILTTRFAFKPLVEALSQALNESKVGGGRSTDWQLQQLTEQVEALSEEVRRLKDAQAFDQKLLSSEAGPAGDTPRDR